MAVSALEGPRVTVRYFEQLLVMCRREKEREVATGLAPFLRMDRLMGTRWLKPPYTYMILKFKYHRHLERGSYFQFILRQGDSL